MPDLYSKQEAQLILLSEEIVTLQDMIQDVVKKLEAALIRAEQAEEVLKTIRLIAEGSTTANSLPNIARIAREALKQ